MTAFFRESVCLQQQVLTSLPGVSGNARGAPCLPVGTNVVKLNANSESGLLCDLYSWFYVMLSSLFNVQGMVNAREFNFFLSKILLLLK